MDVESIIIKILRLSLQCANKPNISERVKNRSVIMFSHTLPYEISCYVYIILIANHDFNEIVKRSSLSVHNTYYL